MRSVHVKKSSNAKIENCYLELAEIFDLISNQSVRFKPRKLSWNGMEVGQTLRHNQPITLDSGITTRSELGSASFDSKTAWYITWDVRGGEDIAIKSGKYRITIRAHGEYQGKQLYPSYSFDLSYSPDNRDGVVIENIRLVKESP